VVNVTLTDLDPLAFTLHFLNQYRIAVRLLCSFCEVMTVTLSVASTAVLWAKSAVYIMALGHFLGVCQY
jgi:hypothetical protein